MALFAMPRAGPATASATRERDYLITTILRVALSLPASSR